MRIYDAQAGNVRRARQRVEARLAAFERPPADLLLLAARIHLVEGNPDRSEQMLHRLVELDPGNLESYNLLGQYYVARGRLSEAVRQYALLVQREPKSVTAQTMLGLLEHAQGNLPAAQRAYEAAVKVDSGAAAASNAKDPSATTKPCS